MNEARYPSLYEINTRVWLKEIGHELGRPTLDDVPEGCLDHLAESGFDWVWLLSVWQTGSAGRLISRRNAVWRQEFQEVLPDLRDEDIEGSGFAITGYTVAQSLGGDKALRRLRERLGRRGLRLMLDFVPNHTALDHPWVQAHPEYYVQGTEGDLARAPRNYVRIKRAQGQLILAHGRDPYFPAWSDTLQLNYGNRDLQTVIGRELMKIAEQCDGVRCDMAMLLLPEVFERTWGIQALPFWPGIIKRVREAVPGFCFLGEVYWDLESRLQKDGFDYTYDKRLYDRLRDGQVRAVHEHLQADPEFQNKLARFLENHDEPRAAVAFPNGANPAAAVITFLAPGLRFFHQGQLEGRHRRIPVHLVRAPKEPVDTPIEQFYRRLLKVLKRPILSQGQWRVLDCVPAWEGNGSAEAFIAYAWSDNDRVQLLAAVNYTAHRSQCYVRLPFTELSAGRWRLKDLLGDAYYEREGKELVDKGLYLDVAAWQYHVFEVEAV